MNINSLPKVELHLHLDCSLSYAVVSQIDPSITPEDYNSKFIAPTKCKDLMDYLTRAPQQLPAHADRRTPAPGGIRFIRAAARGQRDLCRAALCSPAAHRWWVCHPAKLLPAWKLQYAEAVKQNGYRSAHHPVHAAFLFRKPKAWKP